MSRRTNTSMTITHSHTWHALPRRWCKTQTTRRDSCMKGDGMFKQFNKVLQAPFLLGYLHLQCLLLQNKTSLKHWRYFNEASLKNYRNTNLLTPQNFLETIRTSWKNLCRVAFLRYRRHETDKDSKVPLNTFDTPLNLFEIPLKLPSKSNSYL